MPLQRCQSARQASKQATSDPDPTPPSLSPRLPAACRRFNPLDKWTNPLTGCARGLTRVARAGRGQNRHGRRRRVEGAHNAQARGCLGFRPTSRHSHLLRLTQRRSFGPTAPPPTGAPNRSASPPAVMITFPAPRAIPAPAAGRPRATRWSAALWFYTKEQVVPRWPLIGLTHLAASRADTAFLLDSHLLSPNLGRPASRC